MEQLARYNVVEDHNAFKSLLDRFHALKCLAMVQFVETNSPLWLRGVEDFVICSGSAVRVPEASPGKPHQTRANEGRKVQIIKYENFNFIGLYGVGVARRTCIFAQCEGP